MPDKPYTPLRKLIKIGDELWQKVVCHQSSYRCRMCGSMVYAGAHHIVGRRKNYFRFKPEYGICVCVIHHQEIHQRGDLEFVNWLDKNMPSTAEKYRGHWKLENEFNREVLENDVRALEAYCRENGLCSPDQDSAISD